MEVKTLDGVPVQVSLSRNEVIALRPVWRSLTTRTQTREATSKSYTLVPEEYDGDGEYLRVVHAVGRIIGRGRERPFIARGENLPRLLAAIQIVSAPGFTKHGEIPGLEEVQNPRYVATTARDFSVDRLIVPDNAVCMLNTSVQRGDI